MLDARELARIAPSSRAWPRPPPAARPPPTCARPRAGRALRRRRGARRRADRRSSGRPGGGGPPLPTALRPRPTSLSEALPASGTGAEDFRAWRRRS